MARTCDDLCCDPLFWLKIFEIALCLIGLFLFEVTRGFDNRNVMELVTIGLGGYLLICLLVLITYPFEYRGTILRILNATAMILGFVLNMIGASLLIDMFVKKNDRDGNTGSGVPTNAPSTKSTTVGALRSQIAGRAGNDAKDNSTTKGFFDQGIGGIPGAELGVGIVLLILAVIMLIDAILSLPRSRCVMEVDDEDY